MYKTILCAIESSDEGKHVLSKAIKIAEKFDSRLIVINVLPYTFLPKDYQKVLKDEAIPKLEKLTSEFSILKKNKILKVGKPYDVICTEAMKKQVDLIIIGTHSKTGLSALLGSTASGVANYAPCDVHFIKV
ncbi:universal stress protein [Shewanella sp. OPT22]|nr:universal stress protein [Shewanella sp. OPT22]